MNSLSWLGHASILLTEGAPHCPLIFEDGSGWSLDEMGKITKALTGGMSGVDGVRLPNWGSRDLCNRRMETEQHCR